MELNTGTQRLQDIFFIVDQDQVKLQPAWTRENLTNEARQRVQQRIDDPWMLLRRAVISLQGPIKFSNMFTIRKSFLVHVHQYKP